MCGGGGLLGPLKRFRAGAELVGVSALLHAWCMAPAQSLRSKRGSFPFSILATSFPAQKLRQPPPQPPGLPRDPRPGAAPLPGPTFPRLRAEPVARLLRAQRRSSPTHQAASRDGVAGSAGGPRTWRSGSVESASCSRRGFQQHRGIAPGWLAGSSASFFRVGYVSPEPNPAPDVSAGRAEKLPA